MDDLRMPPNDFMQDAAAQPANPISLADLLALRIALHWTEAVAVVEEVCAVLEELEPGGALAPRPDDLLITAQGGVILRRGAPRPDDIDAIGRLLSALLDPQTTPLPLRLFVTQSIGSARYQTLGAYGEALAYYSRPDRAELIREVYLRCLQAPAPDASQPLPDVAQTPDPLDGEPQARPVSRRRRVLIALGTAAVVMLTTVLLLSRGDGTANAMEAVRAMAGRATSTVVSWIPAAEDATAVPADGAVERNEPREGAPRAARRPVPGPGPTDPVGADAPPGVTGQDLPPLASASPQMEGDLARVPTLGPDPPSPALPDGEAPPVLAVVEDPTIYSKASPDVQPPVMYEPKLPPVAATADGLPGTNTMELLIDETGAVQQARLTSRPVRMSDMMLLSPAKTWKFHPATRNGRPVKYRLTMSWTVAPP